MLSECSAAMLLLKLSCSPHSTPATNFFHHQLQQQQQQQKSSAPYKDLPSPAGSIASSSSGHASLCRSATPPSPPLSSSHTDEGIVRDFSGAARKRVSPATVARVSQVGFCHSFHFPSDHLPVHVSWLLLLLCQRSCHRSSRESGASKKVCCRRRR